MTRKSGGRGGVGMCDASLSPPMRNVSPFARVHLPSLRTLVPMYNIQVVVVVVVEVVEVVVAA